MNMNKKDTIEYLGWKVTKAMKVKKKLWEKVIVVLCSKTLKNSWFIKQVAISIASSQYALGTFFFLKE